MTDTKWTPGPWKIGGPVTGPTAVPLVRLMDDMPTVHYIGSPQKSVICIVASSREEKIDTDLSIIAAAPELYEALEALIERNDEENPGFAFEPDSGCIICTVGTVPNNRNTGLCPHHRGIKALAKARGETE